ncbi:ferrous iron transporter B [Pseudomonas oryzihabitans]|nr:ferrous iron transporter B [Pseudomonas psychrotolerans]KTT32998.1 ferrous iron transporter B [Pseudomonas psychrotolerans]KTT34004.1 ferrous iron transporter B [Pseudomonas psychrotolerans]KTT48617.1 ferrous iron transporter B [Pseudomonas psychrotolerans]KTT76569.1 ferrous iron transporter B [Pseudomonas psychrotolerans]
MVTGARALSLVREQLFATIEEAESYLERFIVERHCSSLLQRAVESIGQIRGALTLIELTGAQLLAHETLQIANDIPAGAGPEHDEHLMSICRGLHMLRRYLEQLRSGQDEMPELLLPAINALRMAGGEPELPESYFFSVRLDQRPQITEPTRLAARERSAQARRMRQMYQIGLLGFLRDVNSLASLKLMARALERSAALLHDHVGGYLPWVAAATAEGFAQGRLTPTRERKQLFARVDRELRQMLGNELHEPARSTLKELLYLLALAGVDAAHPQQVMNAYGIERLGFTDAQLEAGKKRLAGPGHAVMHSLSAAIREELETVKDLIDLIEAEVSHGGEQGHSAVSDNFSRLYVQVGLLGKTLEMVGQDNAGRVLQQCLPSISEWKDKTLMLEDLAPLADALLLVESLLGQPEGQGNLLDTSLDAKDVQLSVANYQLGEAQALLHKEAYKGLTDAKRAIGAFLDSRGDTLHLTTVPALLDTVRGALFFLGNPRAAELVRACTGYIQRCLIDDGQVCEPATLEVLADALSSIEFFVESGGTEGHGGTPEILDIAAQSIRALGWTSAAA